MCICLDKCWQLAYWPISCFIFSFEILFKQAFKDDWATRVGVAATSRSGVHFGPGASTHSFGGVPYPASGAPLPLARGGGAAPPPPTQSNSNNFHLFNESASNVIRSSTKTGRSTDSSRIGVAGGGAGVVGKAGTGGIDVAPWLGHTSTPLKEGSPLTLDLKPPSDISHIVGLGHGGVSVSPIMKK